MLAHALMLKLKMREPKMSNKNETYQTAKTAVERLEQTGALTTDFCSQDEAKAMAEILIELGHFSQSTQNNNGDELPQFKSVRTNK